MKILAIRHLPTAMNRLGALQGRINTHILPPQAPTLAQVARNRALLSGEAPFDVVLTSSLRRTRQTARLYGFTETVAEPLLDELDFGPFEGRPRSALLKALGRQWLEDPRGLTLGESILAFEARIVATLARYRTPGTVLLFGHGAWIRGLESVIHTGDVRQMNQLTLENNELRPIYVLDPVRAARLEPDRDRAH